LTGVRRRPFSQGLVFRSELDFGHAGLAPPAKRFKEIANTALGMGSFDLRSSPAGASRRVGPHPQHRDTLAAQALLSRENDWF
jgi:hypothetical protein